MEGIKLNFEALDIWIIVAVVGLAVVGFAVFRLRNKKVSRGSGKQFLGMGIIWVLFGLGYSLWRGDNPFDIGMFNLGLIFTVAGSIQLIMEKYNKTRL
jgi:tellurite resistance protein TehA-like permease